MIKGVKSDNIIKILSRLTRGKPLKVKEITLDLSPTMALVASSSFSNAKIVSDRFHVQRLVAQAISDVKIDFRWQAIELENQEELLAKELERKYLPRIFRNGDTPRQLLARSRHIVMKHFTKVDRYSTDEI